MITYHLFDTCFDFLFLWLQEVSMNWIEWMDAICFVDIHFNHQSEMFLLNYSFHWKNILFYRIQEAMSQLHFLIFFFSCNSHENVRVWMNTQKKWNNVIVLYIGMCEIDKPETWWTIFQCKQVLMLTFLLDHKP